MTNQVIIFHGKYDQSIYEADTDEQIRAAMLTELVDRANYGWYPEPEPSTYWKSRLSETELAFLEMSKDEVDALPESLRQAAKKVIARGEREDFDFTRRKAQWDRIQRVVTTFQEEGAVAARDLKETLRGRDGKTYDRYLVPAIMQERNGGEYEGYEFVTLTATFVETEEEEKSAATDADVTLADTVTQRPSASG